MMAPNALNQSKPWYVYFLCHPDTPNTPFYIGKGIGNRIDTHEATVARGGYEQNTRKKETILSIWAEGKHVVKRKVAFFAEEEEALECEREMILAHRDHITNRAFISDYPRHTKATAKTSTEAPEQKVLSVTSVSRDRAIGPAEAAGRLSVSVRAIRCMINKGEIRAFKVLGQWRIRESEIERVMSSNNNEDEEEK